MRDYFEWNGQRSTAFGVHVTDQPSIIRAPERAKFTSVPGRSGTLTTLEGRDVYDDFILPIDCTVRDLSRLSEISTWLRGDGRLVTPEQPGGYYDARVVNQIEFAKVLRGRANRTFTVTFRCHPFWYLSGVEDTVLTESTSFITNPGNIASEPVITVEGSGDITLMIGESIIELEGVTGSITLDTPLFEAYKGAEPLNDHMIGDFPILAPGMNAISWSGAVTKIEILPNWRYLI